MLGMWEGSDGVHLDEVAIERELSSRKGDVSASLSGGRGVRAITRISPLLLGNRTRPASEVPHAA